MINPLKSEIVALFEEKLKNTKLDAKQIEFAFFWAVPQNERPMTFLSWANAHGLTERCVEFWKLRPEIINLRSEILKYTFATQEDFVLGHIAERAKNSENPRWAEIWLEYFKDWERKNKYQQPVVAVQVNIGAEEVNSRINDLTNKLK